MLTLQALSEGPDIAVKHSVVVGRHPDCDTQLQSHRVSRWHCVLTRDGGEVVVRDLGSRNGIWINGQRVASGRLKPGDQMAIGNVFFRLSGSPSFDRTLADLPVAPGSHVFIELDSPESSEESSDGHGSSDE
jgi:pSer/pThr/pTyr-binding forkhead associated (FHA) protein